MVEEFGSYTNFFFGMLTLTAIILNLGNGLVRFVSELIDQGWDGGRTLARAIAAACGVYLIPVRIFRSLLAANRDALGNTHNQTHPKQIGRATSD